MFGEGEKESGPDVAELHAKSGERASGGSAVTRVTRGFAVGPTVMRRMGITAIAPEQRLSKPAPGHKVYPYLLRGLPVTEAGHVWSADITYLPMREGFCSLTAIIRLGFPVGALLAAQ